ncbi:MAG TPA: hypothetical protein VJ715_07745, partial [Pyrinomonadaceae bacterium]|nr:hypothetical protein [Pyrinomonadaceae bacterium]
MGQLRALYLKADAELNATINLIRAFGFFLNVTVDDLLKIISSVEYEDFGSLQLTEARQRAGNLYLVLDVAA